MKYLLYSRTTLRLLFTFFDETKIADVFADFNGSCASGTDGRKSRRNPTLNFTLLRDIKGIYQYGTTISVPREGLQIPVWACNEGKNVSGLINISCFHGFVMLVYLFGHGCVVCYAGKFFLPCACNVMSRDGDDNW